jgi:hypothetical protein
MNGTDLLEAVNPRAVLLLEGLGQSKKFNEHIGIQTSDLNVIKQNI